MTSLERVIALIRATKYVAANQIRGAVVECGVWRGGSMMAVALTLLEMRAAPRELVLFDTFAGMAPPADRDARFDGVTAAELVASPIPDPYMECYATRDEVTANMKSTGYPMDNVRLVRGNVEDTIPAAAPPAIALLRLDTDWYESTRHELVHLYPRLAAHGALIIDDYGYWRGAREATDEYFATHQPVPFLHRVDYTARMIIKPA